MTLLKYPRTPHLQGSRLQAGDDNDAAMFARLGIKPMAIELTPAQVEAQRMPKGCAKLEAAE